MEQENYEITVNATLLRPSTMVELYEDLVDAEWDKTAKQIAEIYHQETGTHVQDVLALRQIGFLLNPPENLVVDIKELGWALENATTPLGAILNYYTKIGDEVNRDYWSSLL